MPKLSVSVPDELWADAVRLADRGAGPSRVVQDALEAYLRYRDIPRGLSAMRPVASEHFQAAVSAAVEDARTKYDRGYAHGIEGVRLLGYHRLSFLAERRFDPEYVGRSIEEVIGPDGEAPGGGPYEWLVDFSDALDDPEFGRDPAFVTGVMHSLRDVWVEVQRRQWGAIDEASEEE